MQAFLPISHFSLAAQCIIIPRISIYSKYLRLIHQALNRNTARCRITYYYYTISTANCQQFSLKKILLKFYLFILADWIAVSPYRYRLRIYLAIFYNFLLYIKIEKAIYLIFQGFGFIILYCD